MEGVRRLDRLPVLKVLADPRRLDILRYLMRREMTLTQLGEKMGLHPAKVRYHLKRLEEENLVSLERTQISGGYVEKYYRASARAYTLQLVLLPHPGSRGMITAAGSDDFALQLLAQTLSEDPHLPEMITLPQGSLNGLVSLRQGLGQLAGIHLFDAESEEYNAPYVRHFFPDRKMKLIHLVTRRQGLVVAAGNPKGIHEVGDLFREDVRFVNRNPGSGTRLWLERWIRQQGGSEEDIAGFTEAVNTHAEVAEKVAQGAADVGMAVQAATHKFGLDFHPLFDERYDLVIPEREDKQEPLEPLLDTLHSGTFRKRAAALPGYATVDTGMEQRI